MSENKWKKRIHYVLKAAKHFGDEPYMDFFLEREVNPLLLEFKQNGSGVPDKKVMLIRENGKRMGIFRGSSCNAGKDGICREIWFNSLY